jgi:hypothetical protein
MMPIAHNAATLLFLLLAGHALGDYAFQSDFLATAKNQHTEIGREYWVAALPAHALIHGVMVFAVTGSGALGIAEAVAHGAIDWCKNEGWFDFRVDQGLHALCKVCGSFSSCTEELASAKSARRAYATEATCSMGVSYS